MTNEQAKYLLSKRKRLIYIAERWNWKNPEDIVSDFTLKFLEKYPNIQDDIVIFGKFKNFLVDRKRQLTSALNGRSRNTVCLYTTDDHESVENIEDFHDDSNSFDNFYTVLDIYNYIIDKESKLIFLCEYYKNWESYLESSTKEIVKLQVSNDFNEGIYEEFGTVFKSSHEILARLNLKASTYRAKRANLYTWISENYILDNENLKENL